eukprot:EG_transcript_28182
MPCGVPGGLPMWHPTTVAALQVPRPPCHTPAIGALHAGALGAGPDSTPGKPGPLAPAGAPFGGGRGRHINSPYTWGGPLEVLHGALAHSPSGYPANAGSAASITPSSRPATPCPSFGGFGPPPVAPFSPAVHSMAGLWAAPAPLAPAAVVERPALVLGQILARHLTECGPPARRPPRRGRSGGSPPPGLSSNTANIASCTTPTSPHPSPPFPAA